jgi:uncharacterized repeat protein (TIGR02543 family)
MNKKKSIMGAGIITALAGIALVSCGKDKTKSYTITLDANDSAASLGTETDAYTVKTAQELLDALKNVTPTKEGYTFKGWFLDTEAKNKITADTDLSTIVEEDGIRYIYAGFEINEYTVTFDTKGVAATAGKVAQATVGVDYNGNVATAPDPSEAAKDAKGHELTFTGWYASAEDAATNDASKKVNPATIAITKDTTFYAGWTITEISTVDQFVEYVNTKDQKTNAYLSADLTFTSTLDRMSTNTAIADLISSGNLVNSFSAKLYGDDHKITNLKIESDLKSTGIWGKLSGTVQDITFVNASLTTAEQNAGILTGTVENGATITDVDFDSATVSSTASGGYASIVAGQAKEADGVVNFDGITIKNSTLTGTKYNGGILATVVQTNMKVNFTDCVVELNLTASDSLNGSSGLVFGYTNKSTGSVVSFDGVVVSGTIEAPKNIGALVGDNKDANTTINIKNSAVINYTAKATNGTATQVNTFVGQNKGTVNLDAATCYYQEYHANTNLNGSPSKDTVKQGTPVSLETLSTKELSKNITFTYDASTVTLTVKGDELAITAKDPDVIDLSAYTNSIVSGYTGTGISTEDTLGTKYKIKNVLLYFEKAVAGYAGYGAKVTFNLPTKDGAAFAKQDGVSVDGLYNAKVNSDGTVTGYIMLSNDKTKDAEGNEVASELDQLRNKVNDVIKTVTIVWANNSENVANPITYEFTFANDLCSYGSLTAYAAIAYSSTDTSPLTAATDTEDDTKLNITAGEIEYDDTNKGNYVNVEFTLPTDLGIEVKNSITDSTITVTGGTKVSYTGNVLTVRVKVNKGDNTFKINWNKTLLDDDTYTINVGGTATLAADPTSDEFTGKTITFDTLGDITETKAIDADGLVTAVCTTEKKFTIDASSGTYTDASGASKTCSNRLKTNGSAGVGYQLLVIDLTSVSGNVVISIAAKSGKGNVDRSYALWSDETLTNKEKSFTASGSAIVQDSVTVAGGAKYYLGSTDASVSFYAIVLSPATSK